MKPFLPMQLRLVAVAMVLGLATEAHAQVTRRPGGGGEAVVYRERNFSGDAVSVSRARSDLGLSWQARSIRVQRGVWELCSKANFKGRCTRYASSRQNLPATQTTVQSVRPVFDSGWELVGEKEVRDRTESDTIVSWGDRRHRRLRICAEGHPIRLYSVELVFFLNGKQDVAVRAVIPDGQCTRDIDLHGARNISLVNMTYEAFSLGPGQAHVQVFARQ